MLRGRPKAAVHQEPVNLRLSPEVLEKPAAARGPQPRIGAFARHAEVPGAPLGRGGGLHWEGLDLDLSVPALVSSVYAGLPR